MQSAWPADGALQRSEAGQEGNWPAPQRTLELGSAAKPGEDLFRSGNATHADAWLAAADRTSLNEGDATVQEITDRLMTTHQNVSKHLGVLYQAGMVSRRKQGTCVRYAWSAGLAGGSSSGNHSLAR